MTRVIGGLELLGTGFNWPGIGYALVNSVLTRGFPGGQFVFAVITVFVIVANFSADVLYTQIDPRVAVDQ
jgi:peptide/nickel transport system permease protein